MTLENFITTCSSMATAGAPFLFIIDYECKNPLVISLEEAEEKGFSFSLNGTGTDSGSSEITNKKLLFDALPVDRQIYNKAFQHVKRNILHGNSYLLNLTLMGVLFRRNSS